MNLTRFRSVSAFAALISSSAFAATALPSTSAFSTEQLVAPKAVKIVRPANLSSAYDRLVVTVEFTVDKFGNVHHVRSLDNVPSAVSDKLFPAVAQWQFAPFRNAQGNAVDRQVILPIKLSLGA